MHDVETEIELRDCGGYTGATAWILVRTVSDLIEASRAHVGTCNFARGIHIEAHGGWYGSGGFRLGDDTDSEGHIESGEAQDFVSNQSQAAKFGTILRLYEESAYGRHCVYSLPYSRDLRYPQHWSDLFQGVQLHRSWHGSRTGWPTKLGCRGTAGRHLGSQAGLFVGI